MPSTKQIERDYDLNDLYMLEKAQVFHDNFETDKVLFTAAFPHLADPFEADFQAAIDAADDIPSGMEVDAEIAIVTEELNALLELGRKAMQKLFTYVDVAFNSTAKTNSFGKNRYMKARASQLKLKELLETGHRKAAETANQTALIAAGYTADDITELASLRDQIDAKNAQQEDLKSGRYEKTEIRIKAYNVVWEYMVKINQASKVVFADSPAKLTEYLLYPTSHHELPKPQGLTAVQNPSLPDKADLSWDTVPDAENYKVYVSVVNTGEPSGSYELAGETASEAFQAPLTAEKRNYWKIRAFNETQSSDYSDEVWVEG